MKKKGNIIGIIVLLLVVSIGVTFAYYTSSDDFVNVFNTGKYKIITTEEFVSPENWVPGEEIPKTITSTNEGTVPAAVRVSYVEKWEDLQGTDITSQVNPNPAIINFDNTSDWIKEGNYYYYKYILDPNQTTSSFIKSVTLDSTLNGVTCTGSGNTRTCEGNSLATGAKYKLTITKETVQADKYQEVWNTQQLIVEKPPLVQLMSDDRTKDTLQVGDEICVNGATTECFNFIRYDGENNENVVLLSKWNLNVGSNAKGTATNLQDSDVRGYVDGITKYGNIPFSGRYYWDQTNPSNPRYSQEYYPPYIYDANFNAATGSDYSLAYYVENYKDILETYGLNIRDARLLSHEEVTDPSILCNNVNNRCPTDTFITNTSFWLGNAGFEYPWSVRYDGYFYTYSFNDSFFFGVRPVIVISKSDI